MEYILLNNERNSEITFGRQNLNRRLCYKLSEIHHRSERLVFKEFPFKLVDYTIILNLEKFKSRQS